MILTSDDGNLWDYTRYEPAERWQAIAYGVGTFLVAETKVVPSVKSTCELFASPDAFPWSALDYSAPTDYFIRMGQASLRSIDGCFFTSGYYQSYYGYDFSFFTSTNASVWIQHSIAPRTVLFDVAMSSNRYVALGATYLATPPPNTPGFTYDVFVSNIAPVVPASSVVPTLAAVAFTGPRITGEIGKVYRIECTSDFHLWQALTNLTLTESPQTWIKPQPSQVGSEFFRAILVESP